MAEIVFLPGQNRGKTFPEEPLTVGDEIRDANVVRLWRDPDNGKWFGLLGPTDGSGMMVAAKNEPHDALMELGYLSYVRGWPFDLTAPAPKIEIPSES